MNGSGNRESVYASFVIEGGFLFGNPEEYVK